MSTPEEYWNKIPVITKGYILSIVVTTILAGFGFVNPMSLVWSVDLFVYKLQVWRAVTCVCYAGGLSFGWIMHMFMLVNHGSNVERSFAVRQHPTADFVYLLFFLVSMYLISSLVFPLYIYSSALLFSLIYIWSRQNPMGRVSFWGFSIMQWHFPFVLMMLGAAMNGMGALMTDVVGLLAGHVYHFLEDIVPARYGYRLLNTPPLFVWLIEEFVPTQYAKVSGQPLARAGAAPRPSAPSWRKTQGYSLQ